jgi:hypothetical protein
MLAETSSTGVTTQLGIGVPSLTNLLMIYGALSPTSFWNGQTSEEVQGDWLVQCLCYLRNNNKKRIEANIEGTTAWGEQMKELRIPPCCRWQILGIWEQIFLISRANGLTMSVLMAIWLIVMPVLMLATQHSS